MIVGAVVVRGRLDDRSETQSEVYRLVCSVDLGPVCDDIARAFPGRITMTIESAGTTADRLRRVDGDPELDGWLVADPWPAIVDGARQFANLPPIFATTTANQPPLARSPLVIVSWKERADALGPTCPDAKVGWKCLGEAAGRPWTGRNGQSAWGDVKPGHADAATDGIGLLVLGQATVEWFGRSDLSTFDLDDEGFQRWFSGLERSLRPSASSPLAPMLSIGRAAYDAVGTTEADAGIVDRAASRDSLTRIYPAPMVTADVVLAVSPGSRGSRLRDLVADDARDALTDAGWKAPGAAGLPPDNGLPSPGLLDALRSRAREVTGR
ncbi:MAG: hypothetical protein QOE93_1571 [Actinomycetota bacterium]|jgi:hypothetical protein|nr:hypothetical protein [Actinomycetota bacterium]